MEMKKPGAVKPKAESEKQKAILKSEPAASEPETKEHSAKIKEPLTTHHSPLTNMEVHHHPDLHHKRKKFKEYFLEFLMIFLAVTLGFFAETIRETISENSKAKELAKSLYHEVYADSVNIQYKIKLRHEKETQINYFRNYVSDSSLTQLSEKFYPSFVYTFVLTSSIIFDPNDGVLNQLRNSGAQRYFKSIELQNCISRMDVAILNLRNRNNQEYAFVEGFTRPFLMKYYDFKFQDAYTHNGKLSIIEAISQTNFQSPIKPQIRNLADFKRDDAESLAAYYLLIIRATKQVFYDPYVKANQQLLQELRKEYNFNNE
jgi:hypothetical protein